MLENTIYTNSCTSTTTDCCFVECTTTTTLPCINPIDELFNIATIFSEVNGFNKLEALVRVLDGGFILNSCGMCCPDCTYVFASKTTYQKFIDDITVFGTDICCFNQYSNLNVISDIPFDAKTCCNNFIQCAESIFEYFSENNCEFYSDFGILSLSDLYSTILGIGIVEQGTINGVSQVCNIFEHMKDYFETPCFLDEFFTILDKGIVINCTDGRMFISSPETYVNYFNNI